MTTVSFSLAMSMALVPLVVVKTTDFPASSSLRSM